MNLLLASISTETNMFSPFPTGKQDFERANRIFRGYGDYYESIISKQGNLSSPVSDHPNIKTMVDIALSFGWKTRISLLTDASPAGPTIKSVYEGYKEEILNDIRNLDDLDAVYLPLHGAMVAYGYEDCEGDLIKNIRELVGQQCLIGVTLDPHCHLTDTMINNADLILCLKEYPHTDGVETTTRLLELLEKASIGDIKPEMSVYNCRMIDGYYTDTEPMKSYISSLRTSEKYPVLSSSIAMGFPWADTPDVGTKILIITDNNLDIGAKVAKTMGEKLFNLRGKTFHVGKTIDETLTFLKSNTEYPVVLSDWSDVSAGGAPGDSTILLSNLLTAGYSNIAIAMIYDPLAIDIASKAGIGASLTMRVGGKLCQFSGQPLDLDVEVIGIKSNAIQNYNDVTENLGTLVYLKSKKVDIILCDNRSQPRNTDCFTIFNINLSNKSIIVLKAMHHYRIFYNEISNHLIDVIGGGLIDPDFKKLPYKRINRPIWPIDANPFVDEN